MPPKKELLTETRHGDMIIRIGESCLINADGAPPFIGKVTEISCQSNRPEDVMLKVTWYYRPEEATGGRQPFHGEKELFESDHTDMVHRNTVIGKCNVYSLRKYEALSSINDTDYFSRFLFRPGRKEFEPDQVPIFCSCEQPHNPDKPMVYCEECRDWYHCECLGISLEEMQRIDLDTFVCPACLGQRQAIGYAAQQSAHAQYQRR